MTTTWRAAEPPPAAAIGAGGWLRVLARGAALALALFGGMALLGLLRLAERPLFATARPWTPRITQGVCGVALRVLGIGYAVRGTPMRGAGAVVANHGSWLDIFALNAGQRICFVSKSEVAGWPVIGWLARATGTLFIARDRRRAKAHERDLADRLRAGHRLAFFPEGTSTDGRRVLAFKSTLFAAFFAEGMPRDLAIQPVSVIWRAPAGADPRFYGWWGDMDFGGHLLQVLAARRQGAVELVYHAPIAVAASGGRKALAASAEAAVRGAMPPDAGGPSANGA